MIEKIPRVAFFPDSYLDINGAAMTCRKLTEFAKTRDYPFLCVYADKETKVFNDGNLTNVALKRSFVSITINEDLKYDPLFNRHLNIVGKALDEFKPDLLHLTGVNDVSIVAALLAWKRQIPLIGSWHTNLHEFASRRLEKIFGFLPTKLRKRISGLAEDWILKGAILYYQMPKVVLAPNLELVELLSKGSGREAYLMERGVDSNFFSPTRRTVNDGIIRIGFCGRLRAEKNVRLLADLEKSLLELGKTNFKFLIVGDGNEQGYLQKNMITAEFTGFLTGEKLGEAYANMDIFVFPSETDAFGNVAQEANCAGVPAIVSNQGGPKFIIKNGETGFVAEKLEDYVKFTVKLLENPEKLAKMKQASREWVLANSWDSVFEGVYDGYRRTLEIAKKRGQYSQQKS